MRISTELSPVEDDNRADCGAGAGAGAGASARYSHSNFILPEDVWGEIAKYQTLMDRHSFFSMHPSLKTLRQGLQQRALSECFPDLDATQYRSLPWQQLKKLYRYYYAPEVVLAREEKTMDHNPEYEPPKLPKEYVTRTTRELKLCWAVRNNDWQEFLELSPTLRDLYRINDSFSNLVLIHLISIVRPAWQEAVYNEIVVPEYDTTKATAAIKAYQRIYGSEKSSLLVWACALNQLDSVRQLLSEQEAARAAIDRVAYRNITPLSAAARCNHLEVCRELIANGADVDGANLVMCIKNSVTLKFLLDNGANVEGTSSRSSTKPLAQAARINRLDIAKLLLAYGANVNVTGYGSSTLCFAVRNGNVEMAKTLLQAGADANCREASGYKLLTIACSYNNSEIVQLLLDNGAIAHQRFNRSHPNDHPLVMACSFGHSDVVALLLARGLKISRYYFVDFVVSDMVKNNHPQALKLMLQHIQLENTANGITARSKETYKRELSKHLSLACRYKRVEIAQVLLDAGAEFDHAHNGSHKSPLQIAEENNDTTMLALFAAYKPDESEAPQMMPGYSGTK